MSLRLDLAPAGARPVAQTDAPMDCQECSGSRQTSDGPLSEGKLLSGQVSTEGWSGASADISNERQSEDVSYCLSQVRRSEI